MEFVIFCIEAVQKYIFINILLLKKVFNIIFLNYNYCDLILYPSLTMSNFKMIKIFFLKLELQLGMPENQIIQKHVQCFRLGKCLPLKGPQWELTAVLRSGRFLQVTRHTSHPWLKHPPVVRIHILISVYCLGINDPRVLHTTFMVKIEVQED